ncbi:tRNA (N(6)-L-threonylcarbamoyladenosine(37)-C(2))-methylthiotransferase MtaB [Nannocystis punicea]|uniref:tRNA (N(6)-L-threonylcarbamoyladenosine(37)-C(2))-methylthiotransferase n=1 Tax=Nannocystis punicea TaxID=2995304 RepID=A0ABY7HFL2_9BACT|nr:tRNA (N(6)-L-threonylcarbamoyladenosine(37)-C(2))-methylthiotransferase MtaB [Nannocystis poenicansa]WAS97865.1 tRNA (N(6)-L-threonylcarbamoyladenosine(37)-C(2))-methylthiotransferase MtaB [Nannocystis poenicansa]
MRVAFSTHGCRLNQFESDALEQMARAAGHTVVDAEAAPEVVVVNTCTITHEADADARQHVRRAARAGARVVVTGCWATAAPTEAAALPGVALVVGNREKERLFDMLAETCSEAHVPEIHVAPVDLLRRVRVARLRPAADPRRSRAYLKIQDGCDYRCSFCVVPQVRGRSASVPPEEVQAQLQELVAAGVPEVVLTGVHLGIYGRDLRPRASLSSLVEALLPRLGPARLRLGSVDPHEVDDRLVALLAGDPRLCPYLHLPVQSGDDDTLRRMRRAHTAADLRALVPRLAEAVPGIGVGTDVIVGFPGESDEAFATTHALLAELPLAYLHVFAYSPRAGTDAACLSGQIDVEVKQRRGAALRALSAAKQRAFAAAQVGRTLPVVLHRTRHRRTGLLVGRAGNGLTVLLPGSEALLGRSVSVAIERAEETLAIGRLLE